MENTIIVVIGIALGFMQAIVILYLGGIKADIKDIWRRMYAHTHQINCKNKECDVRETGNVIIPHETA